MEHALISLTETFRKCLDDDEIVCGVFVDLQKAFDTVNHEIVLEKVKHYGIRSKQWLVLIFSYQHETICAYGGFSSDKNS